MDFWLETGIVIDEYIESNYSACKNLGNLVDNEDTIGFSFCDLSEEIWSLLIPFYMDDNLTPYKKLKWCFDNGIHFYLKLLNEEYDNMDNQRDVEVAIDWAFHIPASFVFTPLFISIPDEKQAMMFKLRWDGVEPLWD